MPDDLPDHAPRQLRGLRQVPRTYKTCARLDRIRYLKELGMVFEEDGDQEFEYNAYFAGPCACPPNCPNHAANPYCEDESCNVDHEDDYDARGRHSWGSCDEELPDETICPCDAGWEE